MPTTLSDLLREDSLALVALTDCPKEVEVRWVHVTELGDASAYLEGGELVLTAGVWHRAGFPADSFVESLSVTGVVGIGWGLINDDPVPPDVVAACVRWEMPLIVVPIGTPFVALTRWFVSRITREREAELRARLLLQKQLLVAADQNATSKVDSLQRICELVARSVGQGVVVEVNGHTVATAGLTVGSGVHEGEWSRHHLLSSGRTQATIAVQLSAGSDERLVQSLVELALPVVGLVLAHRRAVRESERRLAVEAVSLVLGQQVEAAEIRLASYGLTKNRAVLGLWVGVANGESALREVEDWASTISADCLVGLRGDEIAVVLPADHAVKPVQIATQLAQQVHANGVGIGERAVGVLGLRQSLVQARHALTLASRMGSGAVMTHADTGSHRLLLALQEGATLKVFRENVIGPIEEYDAAHGSQLVKTLRTYLELGGTWQATASQLNIHVNTLRQRLGRIESLTTRQVDNTPDRVDLWLALQCLDAT